MRNPAGTRVLFLTAYDSDQYAQGFMDAGASGYFLKDIEVSELVKGIREVAKGNVVFSPSVGKRLLGQRMSNFIHGAVHSAEYLRLTDREEEVLQLIAEGYANKQMAANLGISIKTVEKHRQQVMNKLNIHDIAGLTRYYLARYAGVVTQAGKTSNGNSRNGHAEDANVLDLDESGVVHCLARGLDADQISRELNLGEGRVAVLLQSVSQKLGAKSTKGFRDYAVSVGILGPNES